MERLTRVLPQGEVCVDLWIAVHQGDGFLQEREAGGLDRQSKTRMPDQDVLESEFGSRSSVSIPSMASQPSSPRRDGDQRGLLQSASHSRRSRRQNTGSNSWRQWVRDFEVISMEKTLSRALSHANCGLNQEFATNKSHQD